MTPRLFVRDEAAVDIEDAAEWYEGRRAGLGGEWAARAALRDPWSDHGITHMLALGQARS